MSRPTSGRLTALLKHDLEQLKEAMAASPSSNAARSPMGANRALVAKCAPDGFSESLVRFRADRPPTSLVLVGRILSRFLGQGGACEEATSPRAATSTLPSSRQRSAVTDSRPAGLPAKNVLSSIQTPLGRAPAEFLASHVGRKRLRASCGASSRAILASRSAYPSKGR